jgi:hypothetical protein
VLGSLLPGVREVRAPLAAGYTWLLVAWLLYGSDASQHPTGVALDLKRLRETISTAGAAVAVGFVAYMIGVFSIAAAKILSDRAARLVRPLTGAWLRWRNTHRMQRQTPWWFSDYAPRTTVALKTLVVPQLEETRAALDLDGTDDGHPSYDRLADVVAPIVRRPTEGRIEEAVTEGVADEFEQMGRQLIGREPELFGEYDRLRGRGGTARQPGAAGSGAGRDADVDGRRRLAVGGSRGHRRGGAARPPGEGPKPRCDRCDRLRAARRTGRLAGARPPQAGDRADHG